MSLNRHIWLERVSRAVVDFIAVQIAGVVALILVAAELKLSPGGATRPVEGLLVHYYFYTFMPLSLAFPLMHSLFGLYTKLRGYTLAYKLRLAALSASVATLLLVFASFITSRAQLPRAAALLFGVLAVTAATGVRWLKDWLFHRESQTDESAPPEIARSSGSNTVLVVGGAGYIGSVVIEKLLERGCAVRLLDNFTYGEQAIEHLLGHPKLELLCGDCRNIQDVVRAMANVRSVIHLAAIVGDPACAEDDKNAFQINYAATRMLIEIAKGNGIERFIFASSCSVYGKSENVMDEKSETVPISLYAETKLDSERALLESASRTFHPVVLRFATVFGLAPRPRFDLVVNLLTAKAIQEGVITIFNGDQWRPFIHVRDIAEAAVQVFAAPLEAVSGEIFNVGDDRLNYTLTQIAQMIQRKIPRTRIEHVDNGDKRNYRVSFRKIRDCVGFTARHSVEDGISEIMRAFELGRIENYREASYSNLTHLRERGGVDAKTELDVKVMAAFSGGGSRDVSIAYNSRNLTPIPFDPDRGRLSTTQ
jgi:nucleoside-diphosphate-sugar epimerase